MICVVREIFVIDNDGDGDDDDDNSEGSLCLEWVGIDLACGTCAAFFGGRMNAVELTMMVATICARIKIFAMNYKTVWIGLG